MHARNSRFPTLDICYSLYFSITLYHTIYFAVILTTGYEPDPAQTAILLPTSSIKPHRSNLIDYSLFFIDPYRTTDPAYRTQPEYGAELHIQMASTTGNQFLQVKLRR